MQRLRIEVLDAVDFVKHSAENSLICAAIPLTDKHAINANDAIVLRIAPDSAIELRRSGDDLVLMASDQRLLNAAQAEDLITFNPEPQTQSELDTMLCPCESLLSSLCSW